MAVSAYLNRLEKIPVTVKRFLIKAVVILVVWKVLYLGFLFPHRVLDQPLTYYVGSSSAWVLNKVTQSNRYTSHAIIENVDTENGIVAMPLQTIYINNQKLLSIEDGCNALELFVLYAGFIVCLPALVRDKIIFIVVGIVLIHIVNIIRCASVGYAIVNYPGYAGFLHHYIFTFVVYGFIMLLWYMFSKRVIVNAEKV